MAQPIATRPTWPTRRRRTPPPNPSRCTPAAAAAPRGTHPSVLRSPLFISLFPTMHLSLPPLPRRPLFFPGPHGALGPRSSLCSASNASCAVASFLPRSSSRLWRSPLPARSPASRSAAEPTAGRVSSSLSLLPFPSREDACLIAKTNMGWL